MFGLHMPELLVILVSIVRLFCAVKLPENRSGIGRGIKNDQESLKGEEKKAIDSKTGEQSEEKKA